MAPNIGCNEKLSMEELIIIFHVSLLKLTSGKQSLVFSQMPTQNFLPALDIYMHNKTPLCTDFEKTFQHHGDKLKIVMYIGQYTCFGVF